MFLSHDLALMTWPLAILVQVTMETFSDDSTIGSVVVRHTDYYIKCKDLVVTEKPNTISALIKYHRLFLKH